MSRIKTSLLPTKVWLWPRRIRFWPSPSDIQVRYIVQIWASHHPVQCRLIRFTCIFWLEMMFSFQSFLVYLMLLSSLLLWSLMAISLWKLVFPISLAGTCIIFLNCIWSLRFFCIGNKCWEFLGSSHCQPWQWIPKLHGKAEWSF